MSIEFLDIVKSQKNESKKSDEEDAGKRSKNSYSLPEQIHQVLTRMDREQTDDGAEKISENFFEFCRSPMCRDLLEAMLDYNRELFRLENK